MLRMNSAVVIFCICSRACLGWKCTPVGSGLHGREINGTAAEGVRLRGRRMLTDNDHVRESLPFANLAEFPKTQLCSEGTGADKWTRAADVLRPLLNSGGVRGGGNRAHGEQDIFHTSGAALLRGLPLASPLALSAMLNELNISALPYTSGVAIRQQVSPGVLQASVEPSQINIEPHWEMSYAPVFPHVVFFYCHSRPAASGEGLTPITDGRAVRRDLERLGIPEMFAKRGGVLYSFFYPSKADDRSLFGSFTWEQAFGTDEKKVVESFLSGRQKDFPSLRWSWITEYTGAPESLSYTFRADAEIPHPHVPGERVWFNQATSMHRSYFHAHTSFPSLLDVPVPFEANSSNAACRRYPFDTSFGDGTEIPETIVRTLRQVYWNNSVVFQWEAGDLLILDNLVTAHGRLEFDSTVSNRQIFVSLAKLME